MIFNMQLNGLLIDAILLTCVIGRGKDEFYLYEPGYTGGGDYIFEDDNNNTECILCNCPLEMFWAGFP